MRSAVLWLCLLVVVAGLAVCVIAAPEEPLAAQATGGEQVKAPRERVPIDWPGPTAKAVAWRAVRVIKCSLWTLLLCHILLAGWVYTDIRKRGAGHRIFILLVLLAGFPAAVVYSLVRIGDKKT